jgi:hypothetical protein
MSKQNLKPGENKVTYVSDGTRLSALVYVPKDYQEGQRRPAIVVTRPASGVKEQTAGLYAQRLSEEGFVTLAFDPKGYGESEGKPLVEDPFSVISDTRNAVTYLEALPQVDAERIFNAGICMGAGYATAASAEDDRIKGTAAISPYLTGHIDYPKAYGGEAIVRVMMAVVRPLTAALDKLGLNLYIPGVPIRSWMKVLPTLPVQHGMMQYYAPGTPGDVPNWKNRLNLHGAENIMLGIYNPFDFPSRFEDKPFFMAYADGGYSTELLQKFYDDVPVDDKDLLVCADATHFDLYYKPEHVDPIVDRVAGMFKRYM